MATFAGACQRLDTDRSELLITVDAALLEVRRQEALAGIHKWQRNMAARGKKATQWLQGKSRPANFVVAEGDSTASICTSLKNLENFWRQIWERQCVAPEDARRKWAAWGNTSALTENCCSFWSAPRLQQQARKKHHSTAGPDGWRGNEIATWPAQAWAAFDCLVTRWVRRQSFPRAWQQMRQAHLPKEESETDGLEAGAMRPIVVTSVLWRVVSSCIATAPQLQQWQLDILHDSQYGGIPGRHLHQAVAQLALAFERGLPMVSLDYAKCFDHVSPSV